MIPTSACKFKDKEVDFDYDVLYEVEVSLQGVKLNSWKEKLNVNQTQFATDSLSYVRKYLP